jgi:hypothetical protein
MKELFEKIIGRLPIFGRELIALLTGPKRFIAGLDLRSPRAMSDAFIFLGISIVIALVAQLPLMPRAAEPLVAAAIAIEVVIGFVLEVAILRVLWKMVGGTLGFRELLLVSCYFVGAATLLGLGAMLVAIGIVKLVQGKSADVLASTLSIVVLLALFVWTFIVWGSYRQLNGVTKLRSGIVLAIFVVLTPFLYVLQYLMLNAIIDMKPATFPEDLVGDWEFKQAARDGDLVRSEIETWHFDANGNYIHVRTAGTADGRCLAQKNLGSYGASSTSGDTLTLAPSGGNEQTTESCSGQKEERQTSPPSEVYRYEVRRETTGWKLCISNRLGERCFAAKR